MITAKCDKCGGTALGDTFQEASAKINHAVGLSRGIKCGDNYNQVCELKESSSKPIPKSVPESVVDTVVNTVVDTTPDNKTKKSEKLKSVKTSKRE